MKTVKQIMISACYSWTLLQPRGFHWFTFRENTAGSKAGRGSVAAVMFSYIALFFFHDPRNKNPSSVVLISTVLFLSLSHFLLSIPIFLPLVSSHSCPLSPFHPFSLSSFFLLTLSQLFSPFLSFFDCSLSFSSSIPSLPPSPVLIVYVH